MPESPQNQPESVKEAAARFGCVLLIVLAVAIAGFLGFLFTQGIR